MKHSQTATILKALADDMRLSIIRCLAKSHQPIRSCDITATCSSIAELSQPAMSHHFKKLADAGIIIVQKAGTENLYMLNRAQLASVGIQANKL